MHFCPKRPVFSKVSQINGLIFASCKCITISMLLCLKNELQVEERDLFDCFGRKRRMNLNEFIEQM